jgi:hypothetical protein
MGDHTNDKNHGVTRKCTYILRPVKALEKTPREVISTSFCEISQNASWKKPGNPAGVESLKDRCSVAHVAGVGWPVREGRTGRWGEAGLLRSSGWLSVLRRCLPQRWPEFDSRSRPDLCLEWKRWLFSVTLRQGARYQALQDYKMG